MNIDAPATSLTTASMGAGTVSDGTNRSGAQPPQTYNAADVGPKYRSTSAAATNIANIRVSTLRTDPLRGALGAGREGHLCRGVVPDQLIVICEPSAPLTTSQDFINHDSRICRRGAFTQNVYERLTCRVEPEKILDVREGAPRNQARRTQVLGLHVQCS